MAKGVSAMLKAAADDKERTVKAKAKNTDNTTQEAVIVDSSSEEPIKEEVSKKTKRKNPGGRPTNKEKGIKSRKQYTLTLKEDTYNLILEKAREEDLSFAKYMERAALEYIKNNS